MNVFFWFNSLCLFCFKDCSLLKKPFYSSRLYVLFVKKITVIIPKVKGRALSKILKSKKITKYVKLLSGDTYKFEVIATELQTQELVEVIKDKLKISKPTEPGMISVADENVVAPVIAEKGKTVELESIIMEGAKKFTKLDRNYILFTICATLTACIGFLADSIVILIGAMLINPLMAPIMAVSYGLSKTKRVLIWKGLKNELVGVGLIVVFSLLMSLIYNVSYDLEVFFASSNLFFSLFIAMILGVVAGNSFITGKLETLVGVAVSISLLPPITNAILLLVGGHWMFAVNALFAFTFNILGMHLSALVFFLVMERFGNGKKKKNNSK